MVPIGQRPNPHRAARPSDPGGLAHAPDPEGVDRLDVALAGGYVTKPSNGWYTCVVQETGEVGSKVRYETTLEKKFWDPIFEMTDFKEFLKKQYSIGYQSLVSMDDIVEDADG